MDQDRKHPNPEEMAGGYGTPTVEQETGGEDKQFAQPREEEAFDAAGLSQDSPEGESGTEDQAKAEQDTEQPPTE